MHLVFTSFLIISLACQENKKTSAGRIVKEWIGKEIKLPNGLPCLYMGRDTSCPDPTAKPFKVLVYTDSIGCTSCKLNLNLWKYYKQEADSLAPGQVDFLFYFQPKSLKDLTFLLNRERMEQVVIVDTDGLLQHSNNFPEGMEYQCFLLDNDNKVISIGNPTLNPKIWEIYKKLFTKPINAKLDN